MKILKMSYCVAVIITVLSLSTVTAQTGTDTGVLSLAGSECQYNRIFKTINLSNIKPPGLTTVGSSYIPVIIKSLLQQWEAVSSPIIFSISEDAHNTINNTSPEKVAVVPEPTTLLLLGSGLMGVGLYRRLKKLE